MKVIPPTLRVQLSLLSLLFILLSSAPASSQKIDIPATTAAWTNVSEFETHRGRQAIYLDDSGGGATGSNLAIARDITFEHGTIDYHIALDEGARFSALHFRYQDENNGEHVYLRANGIDNPNNSSGFQYAAVVDGVNYWDLSFPYQTGVELKGNGEWNHVRLIVRDRQLLAYVNDMERPALYIPILDGKPGPGRIGFDGKAWIADVTVTPDATPGLNAGTGFDPAHNEVRYLRNWQITEARDFAPGREPLATDLPTESTSWSHIEAEHHGLINVSRKYGATPRGERRLVWLKINISAREATERFIDLGVSDEAHLYLNGRSLATVKNPYGSPGMLAPRGRATPENARLRLPLNEGENELLVGLTNYFFGWGLVARLDDGDGLGY